MTLLLPDAPDRSLRNRWFYAGCRAVVLAAGACIWGVKARNVARVPTSGPVILAPTHRSLFDIPIMGFVTNRPARFMAKEELFEKPAVAKFISTLGAFPVKRGSADRTALNFSLRSLELGAPVILFPEGTRRSGPSVDHIEDGVAYLAMKAGAPIVPIGVAGTEPLFEKGRKLPRLGKVCVEVGEPIPVAKAEGRLDREAMKALVLDVQQSLQVAFDTANAALALR